MDITKRILVPLDFSHCCSIALSKALHYADEHHARLFLLHVLTALPYTQSATQSHSEESRLIKAELDKLILSGGDRKYDLIREVRVGCPAEQIVEYAIEEGIDLIIMGTHGRSGSSTETLGTVAARVVRDAPCAVMTVRSSDPVSQEAAPVDFEEIKVPREELPPCLDLVERGVSLRATDIHIDPLDEDFEVRMRIDGRLQHYCNLSHGIGRHIIGQLKTLTDLPMTDSLHTWEGRLHLPRRLKELEVRMTSSPVAGGEALALRIIDRKHLLRPLQELGLSAEAEQDVRRMISHREGLVLVVGPTNSGKTTTVYSILSELNDRQQNIISIEDPAEVSVPFVRQLTVDSNHGRTMASGLQTVLRMDPDVIFVGEVRDPTTASLTMRAASSGQYVLCTLHARDAASAVTALRDLDLDERSIAGNLAGVVSQRLIRRVCKECAVNRACTKEEKQLYQQHQLPVPESVLDARGCDTCRDTGYRGMTGVFETVVLSDELKSAIECGISEEELRAQLIENDIASITVDALRKAASHITSLSEATQLRWIHSNKPLITEEITL